MSALGTGAAFSQANLPHADISVQLTQPQNDTTIHYGDSLYVSYTYTNNGPDALPAGDTLFFGVNLNYVWYSVLLQDMHPGNTFIYNDIVYITNPTDSTLSFDLCLFQLPQSAVRYTNGYTPQTTYIDDDSSNDKSCVHVTLEGPDTTNTGIHDVALNKPEALSLFPNPASGKASFNFAALPPEKTITMKIKDITGRTVLSEVFDIHSGNRESAYSFDVSNLQQGMYLVTLETSHRKLEGKLVVRN